MLVLWPTLPGTTEPALHITIKSKSELTLSARCKGQNILMHGGGFLLSRHELNGGNILLSYSLANASLHEHHTRVLLIR